METNDLFMTDSYRILAIDLIIENLFQGKFFRCNDISKMTEEECQ